MRKEFGVLVENVILYLMNCNVRSYKCKHNLMVIDFVRVPSFLVLIRKLNVDEPVFLHTL